MRRKWLIAAATGAVVAVVGAGAVMAQSSGNSGSSGTSFLDRVAQKLGIESPKLKQAIDDTRNEDIDAAVQRGDLTQQQADALKQKAANGPEFFGAGGLNGPKGRGFAFGFGFGLGFGFGDAPQKFADFLGITPAQLTTELQANGATLATVAGNHGKSRDDLKGFITSTAKTELDQAVQNKKLPQATEDQILTGLNNNLDKLIDATFPGKGMGKGMFQFRFRGGNHGRNGNGGESPLPMPPSSPAPGTSPVPQQGGQQGASFQF